MNDLQVVDYGGTRVLTTQQLAEAYETSTDTVTKNFNRNKDRYIEGKHYICLKGEELREFRANGQIDLLPNIHTYYLWTEKGAFLHAKSLNTDKAWDIYDRLVEFYFTVKKVTTENLSPQTQLMLQLAQSIAVKEIEDRERDRKIAQLQEVATKAVETTENIKNSLLTPFGENWNTATNSRVRAIGYHANLNYQNLFVDMYAELERRAGCDLSARVRNKRERMELAGNTQTAIKKECSKLAVISEDKKLKQIFETVVKEYEVKYRL